MALLTEDSHTIYPAETLALRLKKPHLLDHDAMGILAPVRHFDDHNTTFVASSLSTMNNNALSRQIKNVFDHPFNIDSDTHIADLTVLTPEPVKHVNFVHPGEIIFMIHRHA